MMILDPQFEKETAEKAPGAPGTPPRWTSSRKEAIGTAHNPTSHLWFTLSHGIINELYYPRIDRACTRDMGFMITGGDGFFSEEKRDAVSKVSWTQPGVPAFSVTNTCKNGRYEISKRILADPNRHVLLQKTHFVAKQGKISDYHLYVLLAPHLHNFGAGNTAWVGDYKGAPMLLAERDGTGLALASSAPWLRRSAGFVGFSDGWQDVHHHKEMRWQYARAENGNVALTGEIDLSACDGDFLLVLAFGRSAAEAAHRARASLIQSFDMAENQYHREWQDWQKTLLPLDNISRDPRNLYRISAAVINSHEATDFPGGIIASLSIPWGAVHGDNDIGGYHLVWPRDAYECCGAMLAAGAKNEARRTLNYFEVTQEADGRWPQNMWLDGSQFWTALQMDETAAPILLLDLAWREGLLTSPQDKKRLWPMVRKAAAFIARNGPTTTQDRWEQNPGFSPFTLATEIAALLAAADFAIAQGQNELTQYLQETADAWNDSIEDWIYATGTDLARRHGIDGYYVRTTPIPFSAIADPRQSIVTVKNRSPDGLRMPASEIVSPDALALVRFGLRAPNDIRILNTIKIIDVELKTDTPCGPAWHRYSCDGYGEKEDGSPFDKTGIGRPWPLLTGERAHYELAAGRPKEARRLLAAMETFADDAGMLPEQIWDSADIPHHQLFFGRPSGSARPLAWAHAEYIKLLRSLQDGQIFDCPPQTVKRYLQQRKRSSYTIWRFSCQTLRMPQGRTLRIETKARVRIRWTADDWAHTNDLDSRDTGIGIHTADLPTQKLTSGSKVIFTFYWPEADRWEGRNFVVTIQNHD